MKLFIDLYLINGSSIDINFNYIQIAYSFKLSMTCIKNPYHAVFLLTKKARSYNERKISRPRPIYSIGYTERLICSCEDLI